MNDTQIILAFYEFLKAKKKGLRSEADIKQFAYIYLARYELLIGDRLPGGYNKIIDVCKYSMAELNHIAQHDMVMPKERLIVT